MDLMNSADCYFFIDLDDDMPEEERMVSVMCLECHDEHFPNTGWLYEGSKEGYGPWDYKCRICGRLVHKADDCEEENSETAR